MSCALKSGDASASGPSQQRLTSRHKYLSECLSSGWESTQAVFIKVEHCSAVKQLNLTSTNANTQWVHHAQTTRECTPCHGKCRGHTSGENVACVRKPHSIGSWKVLLSSMQCLPLCRSQTQSRGQGILYMYNVSSCKLACLHFSAQVHEEWYLFSWMSSTHDHGIISQLLLLTRFPLHIDASRSPPLHNVLL